jgi:hypothetical protein
MGRLMEKRLERDLAQWESRKEWWSENEWGVDSEERKAESSEHKLGLKVGWSDQRLERLWERRWDKQWELLEQSSVSKWEIGSEKTWGPRSETMWELCKRELFQNLSLTHSINRELGIRIDYSQHTASVKEVDTMVGAKHQLINCFQDKERSIGSMNR